MIELLVSNAGVNLAVGLALLGVWRTERGQVFARSLGGASSRRRLPRPPFWPGSAAAVRGHRSGSSSSSSSSQPAWHCGSRARPSSPVARRHGASAEQIVVTDETAHVDATLTLLHQATHDERTGLPNRSALQQRRRALCEAELAQAVRQLLLQPFELPQHRFFLDVSIGIALYPSTATNPDALLRSADAAMHQAKRTPGTSVQFAEERFERGSGATLEAEQALRAGMKGDELMLVYQPKVDARSGTPVGFASRH